MGVNSQKIYSYTLNCILYMYRYSNIVYTILILWSKSILIKIVITDYKLDTELNKI